MRTSALLLGGLLGVCALPASVRAYSDPQLFRDQAEFGGGGGRFFTGSPLDGYTCAVCHRGGVQPEVVVTGFPAEYVPGATYWIEMHWQSPEVPHALNLELINQSGEEMNVTLDDPDEVPPQGRCDGSAEGDVASSMTRIGRRQIISVSNCGSSSLRFRFRAPKTPGLAFSAAIVRADASEDAEGDGVLELKRVFHSVGNSASVVYGSAGCSVAQTRRQAGLAGLLCAALAWLAARRRKR